MNSKFPYTTIIFSYNIKWWVFQILQKNFTFSKLENNGITNPGQVHFVDTELDFSRVFVFYWTRIVIVIDNYFHIIFYIM